MKHPRPTEVRTSELPEGGVRIDLPNRPPAMDALGPVMFGLSLVIAGLFAAAATLKAAFSTPELVLMLYPVFCLICMVSGLYVLRHGLFGLLGHRRRIEIAGTDLRVIEQLGRFTRKRKRPLLGLRAFEVKPQTRSSYELKSAPFLFLLEADCTSWKMLLADRSPGVLLASVGGKVREACRAALVALGHEAPTLPMHVTVPESPDDPKAQPADSQFVADARSGETTLDIPPLGFWRARKEPFFFCAIWLTVTSFFTFAGLSGKMAATDVTVNVMFLLWMFVFWSVGLLVFNIGLRVAFTRVVLSVKGSQLFLTRTGLFGVYDRRWRCVDVKEIELGPSVLLQQKGQPPIPEVQIRFKAGGHFGVLAGRPERELRWVAAALTKALDAAAERNPHPTLDLLEQPAESRAVLERSDDGLTLKMPPQGFHGKIPWMGLGGLTVGLALSAVVWSLWTGVPQPWSWYLWVGMPLLGVVSLLGYGLALEAVAFACCRRVLTVEDDVLTSWYTTWWGGIRKKQWARAELKGIDVGPLNPTGAFFVLPQIQLHRMAGRPKRFLIYHTEEELLWIATLLREALRLPAPKGKS